MDLLRHMQSNRQAKGIVDDPKPQNEKKKPKSERAKKHESGSKNMRQFIIDEKPSKKIVKTHFESLVARECESSDED